MTGNQIQLWPGWKIIKEIGAGSFGRVYEIHRQNGVHLEKAALKVIQIPSSQADLLQLRAEGLRAENTEEYLARHVDEIRNEIGLMQQFVGYSNIVSYEDYRINKHTDDIGWDILIRMELLTAMSDYMNKNPLTEELVLKMGMDISQALVILHGAGIIHRDIKPQNIFLNDRGFFKLGDFGISRSMPQTGGVMSFKGSVAYMAPETFAMRGTDARSDIYSLALVLHRCLNGGREPLLTSPDFTPAQKEEAQHRRLIGVKLPAPAYASKATAKVLATALDPNPAKRYQTAAQFYQALANAAAENTGSRRLIPQQILRPVNTGGSGSRSGSTGSRALHTTGTNSGTGTGTSTGKRFFTNGGVRPVGSENKTGLSANRPDDFKRRGLLACGIAAAGVLVCIAVWAVFGGMRDTTAIESQQSVSAVIENQDDPGPVTESNTEPEQAENAKDQTSLSTDSDGENGAGPELDGDVPDDIGEPEDVEAEGETLEEEETSEIEESEEEETDEEEESEQEEETESEESQDSSPESFTYSSGDVIPVEIDGKEISFGEMTLKDVMNLTGFALDDSEEGKVVNKDDLEILDLSTGSDINDLSVHVENHDYDSYRNAEECRVFGVSYVVYDADQSSSADDTMSVGGVCVGDSKEKVIRTFGEPEGDYTFDSGGGYLSYRFNDYFIDFDYTSDDVIMGMDITLLYW